MVDWLNSDLKKEAYRVLAGGSDELTDVGEVGEAAERVFFPCFAVRTSSSFN